MAKGGFTFVEACRAFDCMSGVLADGVVTGSKINLGRVGALMPVRHSSRECHMSFKRVNGGKLEAVKRVYAVGPRLRYRFRVFETFLKSHQLDWFADH